MEFTMENAFLKVTVTTWGAQVKSVLRKCDGVEHIWQADPAVWGYHAPVLFPYAGKVQDGTITIAGKNYDGSRQHGFARNLEHTPVFCGENTIVLELTENDETLTVENQDEKALSFGIGYHPAFTVPFDDKHTYADYELRFDSPESPICLEQVGGLIGEKHYYLGKNIRSIDVDEHLFDNDSHCMTGLSSRTLGLYEKDTGRGVVCAIHAFPYVLLWSKPGQPRFVCIEPWNSLPSPAGGGTDWAQKPAAAILAPGETWSTTLTTAFVR